MLTVPFWDVDFDLEQTCVLRHSKRLQLRQMSVTCPSLLPLLLSEFDTAVAVYLLHK